MDFAARLSQLRAEGSLDGAEASAADTSQRRWILSIKDSIAAADAALARPADFTGAVVVTDPPAKRPTVVHSTRLPAEYSEELEAEADRRGTNPSKVMQQIVVDWFEARRQSPVITVKVVDLHRALDSVAALHRPEAAA